MGASGRPVVKPREDAGTVALDHPRRTRLRVPGGAGGTRPRERPPR